MVYVDVKLNIMTLEYRFANLVIRHAKLAEGLLIKSVSPVQLLVLEETYRHKVALAILGTMKLFQ